MTEKSNPRDVAAWMVEELEKVRYMEQDTVVHAIASRFGDEFTYVNDNGNIAIDPRVLREFRKLTGETVVWDKSDRLWRIRDKGDSPGRSQ